MKNRCPVDTCPPPGHVGLDIRADCPLCGRRVKVTKRGLYAPHQGLAQTGRRDLEAVVQAQAMSNDVAPKKPKADVPHGPLGCIGDHGKCPEPVLAKERCGAHYRRHNRGGDDGAPVKVHRGELVPFSTRITETAAKELEKAGGAYRVGAELLEAWALAQVAARKGKGRSKTAPSISSSA